MPTDRLAGRRCGLQKKANALYRLGATAVGVYIEDQGKLWLYESKPGLFDSMMGLKPVCNIRFDNYETDTLKIASKMGPNHFTTLSEDINSENAHADRFKCHDSPSSDATHSASQGHYEYLPAFDSLPSIHRQPTSSQLAPSYPSSETLTSSTLSLLAQSPPMPSLQSSPPSTPESKPFTVSSSVLARPRRSSSRGTRRKVGYRNDPFGFTKGLK
jgi:hypothetical protein